MAVTIRDVACAAGVSASTVCRALGNPGLVRPETADRVRRVATALGYRPNKAARGLITGRTSNLGVIVPDLANPYFPGVVKGAQTRAREADYAVFLAGTDEDPAVELELIRALSKQVDGIVLCSPRADEAELRVAAAETPLVMVNRRVGWTWCVSVDNAGGERQAVAHLAALGHRRIAFVEGPRTSWANRERLRALRAATRPAGVELVEVGSFLPQFEGGVAAADQVLAAGVTAVVAYNDLMALGLLNRLAARKVDVPGEISVVGCDDIILAAMVSPALTSIAIPKEDVGRAGVELMLRLLADSGQGPPTRRQVPTHLMVRGTTGPARPE